MQPKMNDAALDGRLQLSEPTWNTPPNGEKKELAGARLEPQKGVPVSQKELYKIYEYHRPESCLSSLVWSTLIIDILEII